METLAGKIIFEGSWRCIPVDKEHDNIEWVQQQNGSSCKIPLNWELQGMHNYDGIIWYVKDFFVPGQYASGNPVTVFLGGIDYFADIYCNGAFVGKHEGYFQSFEFPVTELLKAEEKNQFAIRVESPRELAGPVWPLKKELIKGIFNHHDCRPGGWNYEHGQDRNTGGIWNTVELRLHNKLYVENLKISVKLSKSKSKATISGSLFLINDGKVIVKDILTLAVLTPDGTILSSSIKVQVRAGRHTVHFNIPVENPKLWYSWDLGDQPRYAITISGDYTDAVTQSFGIREVYLDENKIFYLNGKRLFLRGTNIIPEQFLSILSKKKIERQVALMKEANINVVRVHAHVCRKEFYEACDKAGIIVWQDFPLQWTYSESEKFADNAVRQIGEMVNQLYNHPSIAFWCCHNEPGEQIHTLDERLYERVKELDSTRIIKKASNYEEHPYDGWYWGNKEHYAATPMGPLVTEFGAQALPELKTLKRYIKTDEGFPEDWAEWEFHNFQPKTTFCVAQIDKGKSIEEFIVNSQTYQAEVIKTALDFYRRKKHNGITGVFQFMFMDCWESITWSVVDYYFGKKAGYYALKNVFSPLYLSLQPMRTKHVVKDEVQLSLWIINDLHVVHEDCEIVIKIGNTKLYTLAVPKVDADSVQSFSFEKVRFHLPEKFEPGNYRVDVALRQQGRKAVLSTNTFPIEIITI
ncbi:MAG: beta-galactosidase [Ignavibacteriales bacterium]|nr:beta-galactosidase [Ignavibacteriales bacterium]